MKKFLIIFLIFFVTVIGGGFVYIETQMSRVKAKRDQVCSALTSNASVDRVLRDSATAGMQFVIVRDSDKKTTASYEKGHFPSKFSELGVSSGSLLILAITPFAYKAVCEVGFREGLVLEWKAEEYD